jgi:ribosomal protein S21
MYVEVKGTTVQDLERALSYFNKQVKKNELFETMRKKEHYVKKSKRLEFKRQDASRKRRREQAKLNKKPTF